jgi:maleylpyruvate isomerase
MTTGTALPHLEETILATTRYLAAIEGLDDASLRQPSTLPGWTRAHVIAHVIDNADGLSRLFRAAQTGEELYMYESRDSRERSIEEKASWPAGQLVEESSASSRRWLQAANELHADNLDVLVARMAGAKRFAARAIAGLRRTEVEIHHADLLLGYTAHDWPEDFVDYLLHRRQRELSDRGHEFVMEVTDTGGTIHIGGSSGPVVRGAGADLAWWLVGRGSGEALTCSSEDLPELGGWL